MPEKCDFESLVCGSVCAGKKKVGTCEEGWLGENNKHPRCLCVNVRLWAHKT